MRLTQFTVCLFVGVGVLQGAIISSDTASLTISGVNASAGEAYTFDVYTPSLVVVNAGFTSGPFGTVPQCLSATERCFASTYQSFHFANLSGYSGFELSCPVGISSCSADTYGAGSMFGGLRLAPGRYTAQIDIAMNGLPTSPSVTNTFVLRAQVAEGSAGFVAATPNPEPSTVVLLGSGILGAVVLRYRRNRNRA